MIDPARPASGETYFFRDQGQFDLLRLRLLPELIAGRRADRCLRLWSAGCATGEEAYSLAMLLDMMAPEIAGWDVFLLGTDIDETALAKARRGCYGPWSFRMVPAALQQRYFRPVGDEWVLDEAIRRKVSFRAGDLAGDLAGEPCPGGDLRDMDLILCRNVLIYFDAATVAAVAEKLAASLRTGGYLVTGHTELMGHRLPHLRSRLFAESVVYQRTGAGAAGNLPAGDVPAARPAAPHPLPPPQRSHRPERLQRPPGPLLPCADDALASAHRLADRGDYEGAERACREVLAADPLAAGAHFLLAQLAQIGGDFERARTLLDKTLYLDPGCIAAYLEQAALCERADDIRRARTLRQAALNALRALPGDAVVEPYAAPAAEMAAWLAL